MPRPTRLVLGDQGTTDPGLSAHTHTPFLLVVGGGFLGTPAPTHMGCEWKGGHRSEAQEQHPAVRSWAWDTGPPALEGRARPERQKPHVRWALAPGGRGGGGHWPCRRFRRNSSQDIPGREGPSGGLTQEQAVTENPVSPKACELFLIFTLF